MSAATRRNAGGTAGARALVPETRTRAFLFGREESGDGEDRAKARGSGGRAPRLALRAAALDRARHGRCSHGALPGREIRLRPTGHRRILLRLRTPAPAD